MSQDAEPLSLWPDDIRRKLQKLTIQPGDYAVFDADNTLWAGDITEALIIRLESTGKLRLQQLDPSLIGEPPRPNETILDRYEQICSVNVREGYIWIVKVLEGLTLGSMIEEVNAIMTETIYAIAQDRLANGTSPNPKPLKAQQQLIRWLQSQGVDVWVVSASPECLVQAIACHPKWGFGLNRSRVIGLNMVLISENGHKWTPADNRQNNHHQELFTKEERKSKYTKTASSPITCFEGKALAIDKWISSTRAPILTAGDSANDIAMFEKCTQIALHVSKSEHDDLIIDDALKGSACIEKRIRVQQAYLHPHEGCTEK